MSSTDPFATIPDILVTPMSERVSPNQVASGVTRGTQTYMNTDGTYMTLGLIPNSTDFGIAFFDASGNIVSKTTSVTETTYDVNTTKPIMLSKLLPDGTYGTVIAKSGIDVTTLFS